MDVDARDPTGRLSDVKGLHTLPSSVLIRIFGKACPSPYDRRLLFALATVCRRFAVVLRQPSELWSVMMLSLPR
jgi:hypothetical protein